MTVLDDILNSYPRLFDKREHSTHYKYHKPLSALEEVYLRDKLLVELNQNIQRPVRIWREQYQPHSYVIKYEIRLTNIRQVQLYKDGETPILLATETLPQGTDTYNSGYDDISEEIIPLTKYYVEIETYDGKTFRKGIPENDTLLGDIYDHDQALDIWGNTLQIPRQRFKEDIPPEDYPYTFPPFFTDLTESDVYYEKRIIEFMENYRKYPLTSAEIKRVLGILPIVTGRWHIVDDGGHEEDDEYNAAVHEFSASLDDIPKNINFSSIGDIQGIIDKTMPCGKKGYFMLNQEESLGDDPFTLADSLGEWVWIPEPDSFSLTDYLVCSVDSVVGETLELIDTVQLLGVMEQSELLELQDQVLFTNIGNVGQETIKLTDKVNLNGLIEPGESLGISESLAWEEIARVSYHDEFKISMYTLSGCSVVGTGSAAYVKLNPANTNQNKTPTGQSQTGTGFAWANPGYVVDSNTETYGSTEKPAPVVGNTGYKASDTQINVNDWPYSSRRWGHSGPAMSAIEVNDGTACYADVPSASRTSDILRATNFKFNVPSDAVITGVVVRIKRRQSGSGPIAYDNLVKLVYNGSERGDNKASTDVWGQTFSTKTYGGDGVNWNAGLTPAMVNSSTFGVDIQFYNASSYSLSAFIDYVDIIVYYNIPSEYNTPKDLNLTGLSYTIPQGSEVVGVMARVRSYCETSNRVLNVTVTAGGVSKIKSLYIPTSTSNLDFGGENDLWGGLPSTPGSYNTVTMALDVTTGYHVRIYHVTLYVYYRLQDGTLVTGTITAPGDGQKWDKLEADQQIPVQCGDGLRWDILKASDNTVLLANRTPPVDLSGLVYQNLKVRAKFHTDNYAYYPRVNMFSVTALKSRSY